MLVPYTTSRAELPQIDDETVTEYFIKEEQRGCNNLTTSKLG